VARSTKGRRTYLMCSAAISVLGLFNLGADAAVKPNFEIPAQPLPQALTQFGAQSGIDIVADSALTVKKNSRGAHGADNPNAALQQLLSGTGLTFQHSDDQYLIVAANTGRPAGTTTMETVTVTAQRVREDIQNVPIAVSAFSQKQLTERQIATGGDLIRETPNMNFGKTNFSGYSIELRGIGTQAISVTTDPAVAVAFNGIPFIRNHFFEQEFYDVSSVEVLRGPQGTLWGRNATAGVVNLISAKPTDTYEAVGSVDIGNYSNRRLEGMINIPIVGDKLDMRAAAEWTMRDGYSNNGLTGSPIDGRDLWSGRLSFEFKPTDDFDASFVWEHFSEDDDRLRSSKQLCHTAPTPTEVDGQTIFVHADAVTYDPIFYMSQGCQLTSLYSKSAFEVPNGLSLPYASSIGVLASGIRQEFDPYASTTQSTNLRTIESTINPTYHAKNDTLELLANYQVTPELAVAAQTGFNNDFLRSIEDYNRFNTAPGMFEFIAPAQSGGWQKNALSPDPSGLGHCSAGFGEVINDPGACFGLVQGSPCRPSVQDESTNCEQDAIFCDPQLGCSNRLVAEDLSEEHSWQFSQEFRASSSFTGPFNFSAGANYLHYETEENYYVFINSLTLATAQGLGGNAPPSQQAVWMPGISDNSQCLPHGFAYINPFGAHNPTGGGCAYIDPNPLSSVNGQGHNYFLSKNPYVLSSYAIFGEAYYNITPDIKLTGGLRWTVDQKHFVDIPSELLIGGYGYPSTGVVNQEWDQWTGRAAVNWTPKLDFTDQTLVYASYGHGYKAGGANPPGAQLLTFTPSDIGNPIHPLTFKPEHIEALELGTKNTLLDGTMTLNADIFYYNYHGYQISRIIDRTAINDNFNAHVMGAELESTREPLPGMKFSFAGGYEDSHIEKGQSSVDLMDRIASNPDWMVLKPFVTQASNCVFPVYVVKAMLQDGVPGFANGGFFPDAANIHDACGIAYEAHLDPVTGLPYVPNPTVTAPAGTGTWFIPPGYPGFDPTNPIINNGQGFAKNLSGNQLPNAPHFTVSFTTEYTVPVTEDWAATLHGDFYLQSSSFARVFNDKPYDQLHGYTNVNLSLILNSADGWQVMGYVKNVFNTTALTGDFLNSDDSGLTTNVFLTDPRLYGVRITKHLDQDDGFWGRDYSGYDLVTDLFADADKGKPPLWIELGGNFDQFADSHQPYAPPFLAVLPASYGSQITPQKSPSTGLDWEGKISFEPDDSDWTLSLSARYGRASHSGHVHHQTAFTRTAVIGSSAIPIHYGTRYVETTASDRESHEILDFTIGRNVGLGALGWGETTTLSGGLRFAKFTSQSKTNIFSNPDLTFHPTGPKYHSHKFAGSFNAKRNYQGIGPTIAWDGSAPILGSEQEGELNFDWGLNGAVLFGRHKASGTHKTSGTYTCSTGFFRSPPCTTRYTHYQRTQAFNRSHMVIVPNIGAFAGLSVRYTNAKISFGYRADEFFGAMDGGIDARRSYDRGFYGPFAKVSIGIGG